MKRKALFSALSQKIKQEGVLILNKLELKGIKTKDLERILSKLPVKDKTLIALDKMDEKVILSARNLQEVKTIQVKDLNAHEVLEAKTVLFSKSALEVLEETFLA